MGFVRKIHGNDNDNGDNNNIVNNPFSFSFQHIIHTIQCSEVCSLKGIKRHAIIMKMKFSEAVKRPLTYSVIPPGRGCEFSPYYD